MQHQTRVAFLVIVASLVASLFAGGSSFRVNDAQIAAFSSKRGVVVLNFWATWCEPCVEEIPIFIRLQKQHPEIQVIGISMDELSQESDVRKFIAAHHMKYRVVLRDGKDFEAMVNSIDPDWMGGLPATFVFRNGKRVFSKAGAIKEKELQIAVSP